LLLRRLVDLRGNVGRFGGKEPVAEDCELAGAVLDGAAGLRREGAAVAARKAVVVPVPAHDALLVTGVRSGGAGRRRERDARKLGPLGQGPRLLQGDAIDERQGAGGTVGRRGVRRVVGPSGGGAEGADPEGGWGGGERGEKGVSTRVLRRAVDNRKTDGVCHSTGKTGVQGRRKEAASLDVHRREVGERGGALDAGDPAPNEERFNGLKAPCFMLCVKVGLRIKPEVDTKRRAVFTVGEDRGGRAREL
jgi:hypothetical protein